MLELGQVSEISAAVKMGVKACGSRCFFGEVRAEKLSLPAGSWLNVSNFFGGMEELYTKNEQVRKSLIFFSRVNSAGFQGQLSRKVYVLDNCLEILYDLWG